jgi:DNA-binding FadR family transcriptional regulator
MTVSAAANDEPTSTAGVPAPSTPTAGAPPAKPSMRRTPVASTASLDAVLRPVRSGNTFEEAIKRIMQAIKLGAVTVGDRLPPERELARRLGVSRVTLREALKALTAEGYVESRRGRSGGTFITYEPEEHEPVAPELDADELRAHLHEAVVLRTVLEPGAAEAAAACELTEDDAQYLRDRLAEVTAARSRETHRLADARLHLAIAELTGSSSLIAAVADAQMTLADLLAAIPVLSRNIDHSNTQHAAIVEAILANDPERARAAMRDHVDGTTALVTGFLG